MSVAGCRLLVNIKVACGGPFGLAKIVFESQRQTISFLKRSIANICRVGLPQMLLGGFFFTF